MCGWFHTTGTWGDGFFPRAGVGRFFDAITNVACELCTYLNKEYTMIKTKKEKEKKNLQWLKHPPSPLRLWRLKSQYYKIITTFPTPPPVMGLP